MRHAPIIQPTLAASPMLALKQLSWRFSFASGAEVGLLPRSRRSADGLNPDAARIQLTFPGKPDPAVRDVLKSNGFRWAPSAGAWQRHLNNAGRYAAKRVLSALQTEAA